MHKSIIEFTKYEHKVQGETHVWAKLHITGCDMNESEFKEFRNKLCENDKYTIGDMGTDSGENPFFLTATYDSKYDDTYNELERLESEGWGWK